MQKASFYDTLGVFLMWQAPTQVDVPRGDFAEGDPTGGAISVNIRHPGRLGVAA